MHLPSSLPWLSEYAGDQLVLLWPAGSASESENQTYLNASQHTTPPTRQTRESLGGRGLTGRPAAWERGERTAAEESLCQDKDYNVGSLLSASYPATTGDSFIQAGSGHSSAVRHLPRRWFHGHGAIHIVGGSPVHGAFAAYRPTQNTTPCLTRMQSSGRRVAETGYGVDKDGKCGYQTVRESEPHLRRPRGRQVLGATVVPLAAG